MFRARSLLVIFTSLVFAASSASALADPGNGNSQGHGKGNGQKAQNHSNPGGSGKGKSDDRSDWDHGPSIDRSGVLGILNSYNDYWNPGTALPPGIQKNLARGKPLPPGIAKKLDGRLLGRLPHYDGYEWQQAGTDLILVAIATGIIYEVLNGALD
ncbi:MULTISPECIES: anti-virulence regulator CigR family protein [Pseudomonas]|jgi:Ni/Co efflux regulator RcnB|uniref:Anti-virulence regulator CigR family protein n=1 Tax=Pseudomonas sp. Hg7Tf TaxID=3236988 RepID=A0AB39I811_9PSED|nr:MULTISPECIES: anti-virulence regulator CigR family protein [Pseudomonas]KJK07692.1 integral membrane protein [Pseudomonas sp. 5]MDD1979310.1 RcnB family protein [Pseudomonas putida]MDH2558457.1 anti-virulence regulator CigR family protein [Pseudomonas sp. Hg5Tf]QYX48315.1 RcnB family protein [Pseudomonas sp. S11A 273]